MKKKVLRTTYGVFFCYLLINLISCNQSPKEGAVADLLDKSGIDSTVRPQDNFYKYVNGGWIKHTEIPASKSYWGVFSIIDENTGKLLKSLLDSCSVLHAPKGSYEQLAGDLYASAMDSVTIEQKGLTPLNSDLQRIAAIQSSKDILNEVAYEYTMGLRPLTGFYAKPDDKNSSEIVAHFSQGGLGLPSKDYYFKMDSATLNIRNNYLHYIARILHLAGDDSASAIREAGEILTLETALAKESKSPVELRDPEANYHKLSLSELNKLTPNINWPVLMDSLHIKQDSVVVGQPDFYKQLSSLLPSVPINNWKNYLRFHIIDAYAPYLSTSFVNANFDMTKLLTGQKELEPRWKRIVAVIDEQLGDALGKIYVDKYFPPEAKKRILELVNNLQATFKERIEQLTWMSDTTKQKAILKLNAFGKKIGYPDKWKDYSSIHIIRNDFIQNLENTGRFNYRYNMNKIGKPVDRSEWAMTTPTINAFYNPNFNDLNFPAGILQPPFFYKDGDDALNYGAIGIIMGHEMTHGFDDNGSKFDLNGNLKNWWLPVDSAKFRQKANAVVRFYNNSVVLDSLHVNGELTQGENIADIGGINIAYAAFKKTEERKSNITIGGLTPDQRFFMAYASMIKSKMTPELARTLIAVNPHSPNLYRVNNPLSMMPAFYKAFNVKPGDKMYKPDSLRVQIW